MEKKNSRNVTKFDNSKDRGDLRKESITETGVMNTLGLGDTAQKIQQKINPKYREDKTKPIPIKKDEMNKHEVFERLAIPKKVNEKLVTPTCPVRTYLDLEGRKRLRDRYTVKLNKPSCLIKNDVKPEAIIETVKEEITPEEQKEVIQAPVKLEVKVVKRQDLTSQRKPIIKTITVKNDNRVYKAVTFVDKAQVMPLQIKMPTTKKKHMKSSEDTLTNLKCKEPSKISIKEKTVGKESRCRARQRVSSPDFLIKGSFSPPTEVAKWVPSCLTGHTKPYYEAWVNTTLAAITKCSEEEREKLLKTIQRPDDNELMYENFKEEQYVGRIKIRQKSDYKS